MAFKIGDFFEDLGAPGIAAGIGTVALAPFFIPAASKVGKPVAKAAVKGGLVFYERSKSFFAEASESFEDMVAESKAELAEEQRSQQVNSGESSNQAS